MKLTPEDERNGWTEETLSRYIREREVANAEVVLGDPESRYISPKRKRQHKANNQYSPHRWRGV
jgi:hypothetical protein